MVLMVASVQKRVLLCYYYGCPFENHVLHKKIRDINDYLQIYLDPEPADKTLNAKIRSLNTGFNRYNAHKDSILETSRKYDSIARIILDVQSDQSGHCEVSFLWV